MEKHHPKIHHMHLHSSSFAAMVSGEKKSELRLFDDKRRLLSPGDHIIFTNQQDGKTLEVVVTELTTYPTSGDLYRAHSDEWPDFTEQEFIDSFLEYYSPTLQDKFGFVRIGIANL